MKKINGILFLMMAISLSLSAQNVDTEQISWKQNSQKKERRAWFNIQMAQHFGLNPWSEADYINEGLPKNSLTEFRGAINVLVFKQYVGIFSEIGIGIMPAPRMNTLVLDKMPMPYQGKQYYIRDILSESGNNGASAHFKMTHGVFAKIPVSESLSILPCFGIGLLTMQQREYEVLLKEEGSNLQYKAVYGWSRDKNGATSTLGYLTGRLNFKYRFSQRSSLQLGLDYTWSLNGIDFYGKYTNTFNANIQREFSAKSSKINMLGVSVGISFM